jgi:hypothetical protein
MNRTNLKFDLKTYTDQVSYTSEVFIDGLSGRGSWPCSKVEDVKPGELRVLSDHMTEILNIPTDDVSMVISVLSSWQTTHQRLIEFKTSKRNPISGYDKSVAIETHHNPPLSSRSYKYDGRTLTLVSDANTETRCPLKPVNELPQVITVLKLWLEQAEQIRKDLKSIYTELTLDGIATPLASKKPVTKTPRKRKCN